MVDENEMRLDYLADRIVARLAGQGMLPATAGQLQACGTGMPINGCENLNYAPITTQRFYRAARTDINQVIEGQIPVAPGSSVFLSQDARPPWPTGCFSLRYRLANNANTGPPRTASANAVLMARPVSHPPVEVMRVNQKNRDKFSPRGAPGT